MRWYALMVFVLVLAVLAGCRQPKKLVLTNEQKERVEANLLKAAPDLKNPLGAELGGAVRLLGVDLNVASAKPGDKLEITYTWEVLKELQGEWKIFGHLEKARVKRQILDHHAIGELYRVDHWKAGDLIRDAQRVTIDHDFPAGPAELWVGLFDEAAWRTQQQNKRLPVTTAGKGRTDNDGRVLAAMLLIEKGAPPSK